MKVGQTRHSSNSFKVRMEGLLSKYFLVPSIFWDGTKACKLTKPEKICKAEQDPHLWIWSHLFTLPQFRNISLPPPAGDDGERLVEDTKGNSESSKDGEKGKLDRNSGRTARVTSSAEAPVHHVGLFVGWHVALYSLYILFCQLYSFPLLILLSWGFWTWCRIASRLPTSCRPTESRRRGGWNRGPEEGTWMMRRDRREGVNASSYNLYIIYEINTRHCVLLSLSQLVISHVCARRREKAAPSRRAEVLW